MKIKCFSKRKLNVRISKTKIKCAILGFSQNCCNLGKSRKKLVKFSKNSEKIQQNFQQNLKHFVKSSKKNSAIFKEKIEIRERLSRFLPFRGCFGQALFSQIFASGFQNGAKECIV